MAEVVFLKVHKNDKLFGIRQFNQDQVSMGSGDDVSLVLKDPSLSPWHSLIEKREEGYVIQDLGGEIGTYVNGEKITESALNPGDQIVLGMFMIEFFINQPFVKKTSTVKQPVVKKPAVKQPKKSAVKQPKKPIEKKSPVKKIQVKKLKKPSEAQMPKAPPKAPQKPSSPPKKAPPPQKKSFFNQSLASPGVWKAFLSKKKSTQTFAPPGKIKNLDKEISPGGGDTVEILVAWGERIIAIHHCSKKKTVTMGSSPKADIQIPNLAQMEPYPIVHVGQMVQIYVAMGMTGKIIKGKDEIDFETAIQKKVMTMSSTGGRQLSLGQKEVVRVNFHPMLRVYIRYTSLSSKAPKAALFDFSESELIGIGIAACLVLLLFFFVGIYYPQYFEEEEKLNERKIRIATIQFKPPPRKRPVKVEMQKREVKKSRNIPVKAKKPPKKRTKTAQVKKKGKLGVVGQVAAKKTKKRQKKVMTSAKPGSSVVKTKKGGSGAKSPRKDPTQLGLLGVFGKQGVQKQLDKAYSGAGELGGLADQATGRSGNKEVYSGKGIGTKFKDAGAGGKGTNLIGISGISTKGKGGGTKGFGRGGKLGVRGSVNLSFGISEMDIEGTVDREAIKRVVRSHNAQLARCHSMILQKNPNIRGKILIQWTIEGNRVTNAVIKNNITGSRELANCVVSRLRNWRFPGAIPSGGIGVVTFPFVFSSL